MPAPTFRFCLLPFVLLYGLPGIACGQNAEGSGFHQAIKQISEERSRIHAYDVTITGKVDSKTRQVLDTTGKVHEVEKIPVAFVLKALYDKEQSKFLVARKDTYRLRSTRQLETTDWRVFGKTLDEPQADTKISDRRFIGSWVPHFDPLGLGLCFEGEFRRGNLWQRTVANYLQWRDNFSKRVLPDGLIEFDRRPYEELSLVINVRRGQWPVRLSRSQGGILQLKKELELTNVKGWWLPGAATVKVPEEAAELKFDWHSVNQAIAPERFTAEHVREEFGLPNLR